jgi:hypothetical protein
MTQYREILRLHALGISNMDIAASCQCSRNTVTCVLKRAREINLSYSERKGSPTKDSVKDCFRKRISSSLPDAGLRAGASGDAEERRNAEPLWIEYCEECRTSGELAYKSTQFSKYYNDYLRTTGATMHLNHKPGELLQVDWAGDTAGIVDTDKAKSSRRTCSWRRCHTADTPT